MPLKFPTIHPAFSVRSSPGQPLADLDNYMGALQRKNQAVDKMISTISSYKSDAAKK